MDTGPSQPGAYPLPAVREIERTAPGANTRRTGRTVVLRWVERCEGKSNTLAKGNFCARENGSAIALRWAKLGHRLSEPSAHEFVVGRRPRRLCRHRGAQF